jgi:2-polyprenyl-6-methoxyphenol hydroxylase-like FAD-dependent oxidoreductase
MRALIVGGGIAGPAAALALARVGIEPVVLERRRTAEAAAGSYFTLAPNGLDALRVLGVLDLARAVGFPSTTNIMYGATGRKLGEVSLGRPLEDGLTALTMKRSQLTAQLAEEAERRGISVHRGAPVATVSDCGNASEDKGGGVVATLQDGTRHTGDLLIGTDGVHSLVRREIDPTAPAGRYVGLTNFGGVTRSTPIAAELRPEAWHFVFGRSAFFGAHPTPEGDVVWFVNVPEPEIAREQRRMTSLEVWQRRLVDLLADDTGPAADLVRAGILELAGDNTYDLPHVPAWTRGSMVVIGDAAHAPSPSSGQGASMALEDAVVLAQALRNQGSRPDRVPAAFAAYERARRARVERIVAAGARSSSAKIPGPIGRRLKETVLGIVFKFAVSEEKTAWMNGHRIDWNAQVG